MANLIRGLSENGGVVFCGVDSTEIVRTAEKLHTTSATCSAALGRLLTGVSLMGAMLKDDGDSITLRVSGGGPAGVVIACTDAHGNVKGCIDHPLVELPAKENGHLDVGGAVGKDGVLTVIRDNKLQKEPTVGQVPLVSGEIAEDIAGYFVESEQIPSACGLGVLVDRDCSVLAAGGYLIQLLPGAGEDTIAKVEGGIYAAPSVTNQLRDDPDPANLLCTVLSDFDLEILETTPIEYRCYCSRERTERALLSLGSKELEDILREQGKADLTCQFCDRIHSFSGEELRRMIDELKKIGK